MSRLNIQNEVPGNGNKPSFEFTNLDFCRLRQLIATHTGITLADHKHDLVYGRLSKRLRELGLSRFKDYCALLNNDPGGELEHFTNAITTNLTAFFREEHHFEHLAKDVVPALLERNGVNKRLRIWSAGCSTGEEPYSLAIALRESISDIDNRDIRILATDINSKVLQTGRAGIYPVAHIKSLDQQKKKRWFRLGKGKHSGTVRVSDSVRKLVSFSRLNLMHEWPMKGLFDVVFCRNVVIYFDRPTQRILFERMCNIMQPNATLFIGHSETLHNVSDRFTLIGKTIYRKTD